MNIINRMVVIAVTSVLLSFNCLAADPPVPLPCDPIDCPPIDPCKIAPERCKDKGGPIGSKQETSDKRRRPHEVQETNDRGTQATGVAKAKSYTCVCDSPCSGSKTCTNGCYAFCEENPEGSGRHVCIKGCSSAALSGQSRMMLDPQKKYTSVNLSMPRERVIPVLEKLYGKKLSGQQVKAASTGVSASVAIHLKNANLNAVLQELGKNTEIEKSTDTPKIIERELTPDTGEYMRTPCYKTERYCTEWLPDGKCKLWDSRQVQAPC